MMSRLRCLGYGLIGLFLSIGFCLFSLFIWFRWPEIRGGIAGTIAKNRVENLYNQRLNRYPDKMELLTEEKPRAGTMRFGLSDGTPHYAIVYSSQMYQARVEFNTVLQSYNELITGWGWQATPITAYGAAGDIYQPPHDNQLLIGVCRSPQSVAASNELLLVFILFEEVNGREGCGSRVECVVKQYCE